MTLITIILDPDTFPHVDLRKNRKQAWGVQPGDFWADRWGRESIEGDWAKVHETGEYWIAFEMQEPLEGELTQSLVVALKLPPQPENLGPGKVPKVTEVEGVMSTTKMYAVFVPGTPGFDAPLEVSIFPGVTAKSKACYRLLYTTDGSAYESGTKAARKKKVASLYERLHLRRFWSRDTGLDDFELKMANPLYRCGAHWFESHSEEPDDAEKQLTRMGNKAREVRKVFGILNDIDMDPNETSVLIGNICWVPIVQSLRDHPLDLLFVRDDLEIVPVTDILYELAKVGSDPEAKLVDLTVGFYIKLQVLLEQAKVLAGARALIKHVTQSGPSYSGVQTSLQKVLDENYLNRRIE